jgi:signal transduction histidine kinase
MHQMISQLLLLSRADAGRAQIEKETINLSELCEMTLEEQQFYAQEKRIQFTSHIEENILIYADMTLMIRLLVNLLNNAITYGKEKGWIHCSLTQNEQSILLQVQDNGIGISSQHLPCIFDRFYQVDKSRTSSNSGLGLSMVKWICDVHNGQIKVDSTVHEGTTFTVLFPKEKLIVSND